MIRLDAKIGQSLFEEKNQVTLWFLYNTFGISDLKFAGSVLIDPYGARYLLGLYLRSDNSWDVDSDSGFLPGDHDATSVSPLLASPLASVI